MSRRLFLIVLILTALVLGYVVSKNIFTFEYLNLYYSEISEYIENNYILSITGYVIIYFIVVLFCLPFASLSASQFASAMPKKSHNQLGYNFFTLVNSGCFFF